MNIKKKALGQFFTNPLIADFMSKLVCFDGAKTALDPAVGEGVFLKYLNNNKSNELNYIAYDVDEDMIETSKKSFNNNIQYHCKDYLISEIYNKPDIIICNPPYNKFQEILKRDEYIELFAKKYGISISGYSNLCVYFLVKSLFDLKDNGKCVYIIPYEFFNTGYGETIKKFLLESKFLKSVYKFDNNISIFDDALTTSCILLFEKKEHNSIEFISVNDLVEIKNNTFKQIQSHSYSYLDYKQKWSLYFKSKPIEQYRNLVNFDSLAKVKRGIATGGNAFFALDKKQVESLGLSQEVLVKCICKSPDIKVPIFQEKDFLDLLLANKKVYLFDGTKAKTMNDYDYILFGEKNEYHKSYLNSHRNPWYLLEEKQIAPIWISVFSRNRLKIIRNETSTKNLTTFHGIYFNDKFLYEDLINIFYCYLLTPICQILLKECKREYGGGLDKFEPNDLNNAKILDLSIISAEDTCEILALYNQIKHRQNDFSKIVERLNNIFASYMC